MNQIPGALELAPGLLLYRDYYDRPAQQALLDTIRAAIAAAPLFTPTMPRTGKAFSVRMSNCGPLGWVSDHSGYRYQKTHPVTGTPWPAMPDTLIALWQALAGYSGAPEACLVNYYARGTRMGLHTDRDEQDFSAPVMSVSLGADCLFRFGGCSRKDATHSIRLTSGDVLVMSGASRLCYHGVDRLYDGTSTLIAGDARLNLTLRRVNAA